MRIDTLTANVIIGVIVIALIANVAIAITHNVMSNNESLSIMGNIMVCLFVVVSTVAFAFGSVAVYEMGKKVGRIAYA